MTSSCSNLHSTTHRRSSSGQALAVVLAVEGIDALGGGLATPSQSKLDTIRGWFNQYPAIKSGRCRRIAPT